MVVLASSIAALVGAGPAAADVVEISPPSATVEPGGGAGATIRIRSEAVSCLTVRTSSASVSADAEPNCGAGDWTSSLTVGTSTDTAPGTYTVRVVDAEGGENGGRNFTLRVREPPPSTTSTTSTTTTTRPTTTTTGATTTTQAPTTTTEPPATTEPPTTEPPTTAPTTSIAGGVAPEVSFVSIEGLIAGGIPEDGMFFPLNDPVFRTCLPLTEPCGGPTTGFVLVPARTSDVTWRTDLPEASTGTVVELASVEELQPVGTAPENAAGLRYALPILDVSTSTGRTTTLVRTLDGFGRLVEPPRSGTAPAEGLAVPVIVEPFGAIVPAAPPDGSGEAVARTEDPFGRPDFVRSGQFTEASPVVAVLPGGGEVVYGLRPAPGWDTGSEVIAFFGRRSVPYLARMVNGPPGLFVAAERKESSPREPNPEGSSAENARGPSALVLLGAALAAASAVVGWTWVRRRRSADPEDLSTPLGT